MSQRPLADRGIVPPAKPSLGFMVLLACLACLACLVAACSGSSSTDQAVPLGRETILEPVDEASDGVLDVPGEQDLNADLVGETEKTSMFSELDALISPSIPMMTGAVDSMKLPDGEPLVLGGLVTETIAGIPVKPGICDGALARLDGAILRGEIGRPVEWVGCSDDAGFSDLSTNALDRLRFRRPFAVVPMMSDRFFSEELLNDEFVPYIGIGSQPAFCGVTNSFGFAVTGSQGCPVLQIVGYTTSGPVLQAWVDAAGVDPTGLRVAAVVDESVSGAERSKSRALEVERLGAQLVLVDDTLPGGGAATASELDRVARAVAVQVPDVVVVEVDGAEYLYQRLREAGYEGSIVGVELDPALLLKDADLAKEFADTWQVISGFSILPQSPEITADAAAAGVAPADIGVGFISGYASMDFLIEALAAVEGQLGPVEMRDLINSGWTYPGIDGVVCASEWPTAHLTSVPCASVARVDESGALREVLPPTPYALLIEEIGGP